MEDESPRYPCPGCGFVVFDEPPGSYKICPLCDWEDDLIQLKDPAMQGGANRMSLSEHQRKTLKILPPHLREVRGFSRDVSWRPLRPDERPAGEDSPYYWRERGSR